MQNDDDMMSNNLFEILLNDDNESLDNFLQNYTDESLDGVVNFLFNSKKIPTNVKKIDQRTKIKMISSESFYSYGDKIPILSISALFSSIKCFNLLLMCDADINLPDTNHRLPVHFACAGGCIEICDMLDSAGADFTQVDKFNRTCLHFACISGNINLVERFWARNFDLEAEDSNLMRPIHFASLCNNYSTGDDSLILNDGGSEVLEFLIDKGCDIGSVTNDGETPFTIALRNSPSVLNYLIENCNVNDYVIQRKKTKKKDETSNNNIMTDFVYNHNAFDDMLNTISNFKNPTNDIKPKKEETVKKEKIDFIDLNNFYITDEDEEDQVLPIIDACRGRRFGIAFALLKRNKDFTFFDVDKGTKEILKINTIEEASNCEEKSKISIPCIDVEKKDIFGWTPLLYATERGCLNIVKLLVKKGANVNTTSNYGFSPLLAAKNRNYPDIAIFLEANGAILHP